jgi:AraC family transcriptional regulator of adaptative response / DNA-3-methyladenine glycosylase II
MGTSNTVSRALRLIGEAGLEDGGVEVLAAHLGVGSRHLRRLFLKHLGATPIAVASTRRLHFAKKLIDETRLPMTQIALASGFGCVRRFNAGFRKVYHRTPTQIRRLARQKKNDPENHYLFRLPFRPPYDWNGMLSFLAARAIPGVEIVADGAYRRSISLNGNHGSFEVSSDDPNHTLIGRVQFSDPQSLFFITERIRAMFDLNADWTAIMGSLNSDAVLSALIQRHEGLRVPGCWNGFELTVRAILGQQVSVKGATTLSGRLVKMFGEQFPAPGGISHLFPKAEKLADANVAAIGLPTARANTIRELARAVCDGRIKFEEIVDTDDFLRRLSEISGIGSWTAQYVAMRALGEPDAFPSGDLGLIRAMNLSSARDLERRAEAWRPWRAYAAIHLWSASHTKQASGASTSLHSRELDFPMSATSA